VKFFIFFFLFSCASSKIQEDKGTLYSRLTIPIENSFLKLELQILSSHDETYGFMILNEYTFDDTKDFADLTLTIDDKIFCYNCKILKGSQKISIPKEAILQIISGLKEKNRIHISIKEDSGYLEGSDELQKKFATLCQTPSIFDTILKEGTDYLNNYQ
jgi:hypothetical protein